MIVDYNDIFLSNSVEYIDINLAEKYLNISKGLINKEIEKNSIEFIQKENHRYIKLSFLYKLFEMKESFWKNHIEIKVAKNKYKAYLIKQFTKVEIPYYANYDKRITSVYSISEINNILKNENKRWDKYIKREDAIKLLGLSEYNFKKTMQKFGIKLERIGSEWACPKEEILFLKEQQKDLGKKYISKNELISTYGNGAYVNCQSYYLPIFARRLDIFPSLSAIYFDRDEVEEYIRKKEETKLFYDIKEENLYERYKKRLKIKDELKCLNELVYTGEKWNEYVYNVLFKTNQKEIGKNRLVTTLVNTAIELDNYLYQNGKKEVYELKSSEINLFINFLNTQSNARAYMFYRFIALVSKDGKLKEKLFNEKKRLLNIKEIENLETKRKKNRAIKKEIYDFNEYKLLFNFLNKIDYHLEQYFNHCKDTREKGRYLSTWLYLVLHLNNAWRNGDIEKFPRLNFDSLENAYNIISIEWFKKNSVSLDLSNQVISIINNYEFNVNKTNVEGHFFCSNQLKNTLATILLMLDLHIKYEYIGIKEFNSPVMMFYTKYNAVSKWKIKTFLKPANIDNFSSLKMNKTILTYIYKLSDEGDSLLLSKYLRSHINEKSTLHYVNINKEDIDFLVEQLFSRGEFGYIYDSLIDLIDKKHDKLIEEKTEEILLIKEKFGDELKIEATFGMINHFKDERKEVLKILYNKGYDECINILSDIYMNKLPSRENNIQCLYSKQGCVCLNVDNCIDCKFSIPSIYALNIICDSIKNDLKYYVKTKNIPQKIKISLRLMKKKELLKDAIKRYGKDYIYSILKMSSYEFLDMFSRILPPNELSEKLKDGIK